MSQAAAILGFATIAEIAVMFVAAGKLDIEPADQRHVHLGRHQRHGELGKGREDGPAPRVLGVGLTAATLLRLVSPVTASMKVIVAVEVGVAIVPLRLAPPLDAERDTDIAAGQIEQIGVRHLEVGERQRGLRPALEVEADRIDRRLRRGRAIAERRRGRAAAAERIIGIGRRQREALLELGHVDRVGATSVACGFRIEHAVSKSKLPILPRAPPRKRDCQLVTSTFCGPVSTKR